MTAPRVGEGVAHELRGAEGGRGVRVNV